MGVEISGGDSMAVQEMLKSSNPEHKTAVASSFDALKECLDILNSEDWKNKSEEWKVQNSKPNGDTCYGRSGVQKKNKTFIAVAVIDATAEEISKEIWENVEGVTSWNKEIKEYKVLAKVSDYVDVTYTVFNEYAGGVIKSRDFVDSRCRQKVNDSYCISGCSMELSDMPDQKGKVRGENGAGIIRMTPVPGENKTTVELIQNTDLKGMIPKAVVEKAISGTMLEYMGALRSRMAEVSKE